MNRKEIRNIVTDIDVVNIESEDKQEVQTIVGYALKFNSPSEDLGGFTEVVSSGALDSADLSDVRALIDHDPTKILGRTTNGTLKLTVDEIGLKYEVTPSDTTYSRDLLVNMDNGNINQCSFSFILNYDNENCETWEYDNETNMYKRTINDIGQVLDVSAVTFPAYSNTECVVAQRGLENVKHELQRNLDKEKILLELELTI